MKTREIEFDNRKSLIVYMTQEERCSEKNAGRIDEYKKLYGKVTVFVSGNAETEGVLKSVAVCVRDSV